MLVKKIHQILSERLEPSTVLKIQWLYRQLHKQFFRPFHLLKKCYAYLRATIFRFLYNEMFEAIHTALYWTYKFFSSRPREVTRVLQFSIISHKPFMLSREIRRLGIHSDYFALNADASYLNIGYDYSLSSKIHPLRRRFLEVYYLWGVMVKYDVIHCHFNSKLTPSGKEFDYLRRLGKLIVFHYRGCDIRHKSKNMRLNPVLNCCQKCDYPPGSCDTQEQQDKISISKKYGDLFFVTTPDLLDFAPYATYIPFIAPDIDPSQIPPAPKPEEVFRVVTSSNHHGVDGTHYVRDAVNLLKSEGKKIELIELNKVPYQEALSYYKSADAFAGKLRMGYYNNANIETMIFGVPNFSYIRDTFKEIHPDCPVVSSTPDTIYENLKYYLEHPDELKAIAARGPDYVTRRHNPREISLTLLSHYRKKLSEKLNA